MKKRFLTAAAAAAVCCLLQIVSPASAQMTNVRYVIEDLSALGANPLNFSSARGINSIGQVVGVAQDDSGGYFPFRWTNGTMQNLGTLGGVNDQFLGATDINDFGWVTGSLKTASGKTHAFLYNNTTLIDLGGGGNANFPGGQDFTRGSAINNFGEVVGYQGQNPPYAFYYDGVTMRNLNSLIPAGSGWHLSFAHDINDKRQVVGGGFLTIGGGQRAYRYTIGASGILDIGSLFSSNSSSAAATAINSTGTRMTGFSLSDPVSRGFLFMDGGGGMTGLSSPGICSSSNGVNDVNARGKMVGLYYSITSGPGCLPLGQNRAVLWDQSRVPQELTNLIDPSLGWTLTEATSINDRGQIVGVGTRLINSVPVIHAFRLTPIRPENSQVADFDGDGRTDLSVYRPSGGFWYHSRSSDNSFSAAQFGIASDRLAPGDYDGDGKTDLAVYRDGTWFILESASGNVRAAQFGLPDDVPVPADFDADAKTDIAVYRPSNGYWYVTLSSDNSFAAQQFGAAGDSPAVGDYDGDARADAAVYRPSNGVWYVQQSTLGFSAVQFGVNTDKPVQGDYDGDGRTDFAVYRPSGGVWYLLRSQAGFAAAQFGIASDTPAPGDYDGDGKFDLGVYRGGTWYLLQSLAGFAAGQFGAPNDKPVPAAYTPAGN
jgi:probable HAF family extracellular repeat protein